jgi:hypothetical protein
MPLLYLTEDGEQPAFPIKMGIFGVWGGIGGEER